MVFYIRADFLLGFYQGRNRRGVVEKYPSPLRLHAALTAGVFSRRRLALSQHSAEVEELTELDASSVAALEWLSSHVPDAVSLPTAIVNAESDLRAYRNKGLIEAKTASIAAITKIASEPAVGRSILEGPITWWWREEPPASLLNVIQEACCEVPYLGESVSAVRLVAAVAEELDRDAYLREDTAGFSGLGERFAVADKGRLAELQKDYVARINKKEPSISQDQAMSKGGLPKTKESENPDEWNDRAMKDFVSYKRPPVPQTSDAPWPEAFLLHVSSARSAQWPPLPEDRVDWAVAVHRAIASRLGAEAPPLITGRYAYKSMQPANRVSIQILDAGMNIHPGQTLRRAAILIAIPRDADPEEVDILQEAIHSLDLITKTGGGAVAVDGIEMVDTENLWNPVPDGCTRWWFTHPVLISDSRTPRRSSLKGREWTVEDAFRVAVGNVFREYRSLHIPQRGDERLVALSEAVHNTGVRIGAAQRAFPTRPEKYAHHMNDGSAIIALQGLVHLGELDANCAFMALGQSRHLGGGLLIPFDLPRAIDDDKGVADDEN